jgi:hypothetical protein
MPVAIGDAFVDTRRSRSRAIALVAVLIEKKNRNDQMRMLEIADTDFAREAHSKDGSQMKTRPHMAPEN